VIDMTTSQKTWGVTMATKPLTGKSLWVVLRIAEELGIPERFGVTTCEAARILLQAQEDLLSRNQPVNEGDSARPPAEESQQLFLTM